MSKTKEEIGRLLIAWGITLLMSLTALGLSIYVVARERINYSCERSGHAFEARFDIEPPSITEVKWNTTLGEIHALTKQTYAGDVCRYCGASIPRRD
jgi:hypothetical protein